MDPAREQTPFSIKVMTYNIHGCVNVYGRENPAAIARVISLLDPDAVALQEVDAMGPQMDYRNQAEWMAERLGMHCHFIPLRSSRWGKFGSAVLSRYAVSVVKSAVFPGSSPNHIREPRGAIWVRLHTPGGDVHFFNTHLSLRVRERLYQIRRLLSKDWLGGIDPGEPIVFCGDLNAGARSLLYKVVSARLADAQVQVRQKGYPKPTFFSLYPVLRIDHIFVSGNLSPTKVKVPLGLNARKASDHLPVWARLSFAKRRANAS